MSSILEALRELEESRPRTTAQRVAAAEVPSRQRSGTGAFIPVAGGLALGILVFGTLLWSSGVLTRPKSESQPIPVETAPSTPTSGRPAWLDGADAPRARIDRGASSPPAPARDETPAAAAPAAAPASAPPTKQTVLESISYSPNVTERSATLRVNGKRVTLRQRESVDGLEVQLINPNSVYVQRGSEVYLITPWR